MKKNQLLKIWFISAFLLMSGFSHATENYGEEKGCKNLGKVTDIDDLLYQFYRNIDSQCLFEIPTKELEKVWGIRIIDYTNPTREERESLNKEVAEMFQKADGLLVTKTGHGEFMSFSVSTTGVYQQKNWGGSVGEGKFPRLLPAPTIKTRVLIPVPNSGYVFPPWYVEPPVQIPSDTMYKKDSKYYWINKDLSGDKPGLYGYTPIESSLVGGFEFYNKVSVGLKFLRKGVDYDIK